MSKSYLEQKCENEVAESIIQDVSRGSRRMLETGASRDLMQ